jgi:hypothetical protein
LIGLDFEKARIGNVFCVGKRLVILTKEEKVWSRSTNVCGRSNVSCGKSICIDEFHVEITTIVSGVSVV